jgi:threonine aldolase
MLSFVCDYLEGAHPKILERLSETNMEQLPGYGSDRYCESAKEKIRAATGCPEADIYFLAGGTQTNSTVIAGMLRGFEGVVAARTGHINVHESGAVEYTGHKILPLPEQHGKMVPREVRAFLETFFADANREHMVFPGMVYISHPTEYGTLYSLQELTDLSGICREFRIPLFLDGARLGYGLMSRETDVSLPDIARLCDVFYIGGTKVGALCGEALVFPRGNAPARFLTTIKQHGALLAKGRLLGVQFDTLFTDNLYFKIAGHAIDMADRLREVLHEKGCRFFLESPTNQQFIILDNKRMDTLARKVGFDFWMALDDRRTVVRFATSWATTPEQVEALRELL